MQSLKVFPVIAAFIVLALAIMACGALATPTPPPLPTETATTQPTATLEPTATPRPTATPNLAATQQYESWQEDVQFFMDKGYLNNPEGEFSGYDDFSEDWAQINWYKWWPYEDEYSDFLFGGHFNWQTASSTPDTSGCGIVFGIQENGDHYAVFLDKGRILFLMSRGSHVYNVGKTSGSGRANFGNPAEADFRVLVQNQKAYVSVNGDVTSYTLSQDQSASGGLGLTVLSGTNRDYGTRCKISDIHIWTPK